MAGYVALSLDAICNAGLDILESRHVLALGAQLMRGIPFDVHDDPARCFVLLGRGGSDQTASLHVNRPANSIIIAHRLLDSRILSGGPVGEVVAHYRFLYEDGHEIAVPIRERFEVAVVPMTSEHWGQRPLLALSDQFPALPARTVGSFARAGLRMTEVEHPEVRCFLWAWKNPRPDSRLAEVSFSGVAGGPRVLVAGVAISDLEEEPLRLSPAQPVKVDMSPRNGGGDPLDVSIEVDRGVTTFAFSLPDASMGEFLSDPLRGWGEPRNRTGTPNYASLAALPSATVTVKQASQVLGRVNWGQLEASRKVTDGPVSIELVESGRNWVRTVVVDDATDEPVPCRIHFRSAQGVPYQPHGHPNQVNGDLYGSDDELSIPEIGTWHMDVGGDVRLGRITYAYIDGSCEGWLPRGEIAVDVARGFEYEPLRATAVIEPGQRDLRLRLKRWSDVRKAGWYPGDTHVHFLSVAGCHTEARGEDLSVVNLLATQFGSLFTNTEDFAGRPSVSADGETIVYVSQENRQHLLGHILLLGLKSPVMPWCSDGTTEAEMGGSLETTLAHWADRCHDQGGLVVLPHFPNPNGEPATLIATGRVDAIEFVEHKLYRHTEYYRYLNCGYRLPLVGGTDKLSADVPVGICRTYARVQPDQGFSYQSWCDAIAAGRTFVSTGPMISLSVDGRDVGDLVRLPQSGGTIEVEARADSIFPIHTLEIIQQGRVVASTSEPNGTRSLGIRERLSVTANTWIAARVSGPGYAVAVSHRDEWSRGVMAHTSPIYVSCGDEWDMWDRSSGEQMLTMIEGGLSYVRELSPQWEPGRVTHHHGEADHRAYLDRPFLEARAAIASRLARSHG